MLRVNRPAVAALSLAALAIACGGSHDDRRHGAGVPAPPELVPGPLIEYVDPFIGTGGVGFGVGSAYPGPAMPFGMIHPGPDTGHLGGDPDFTHFSGYHYDDDEIFGFSHARLQGTGAADLGNVLVMPTDGFTDEMASDQGYRSRFSHDTEAASPGYYAVTLEDSGIRVELTAARRAAMHRYTFPAAADATVVFDPTHFAGTSGHVESASVRLEPDGSVRGRVHYFGAMSGRDGGIEIYFVAELDRPVRLRTAFEDGAPTADASFQGTSGGIAVALDGGGAVRLRIAISLIDEAQAAANLAEEDPDWDFDAMRARAEDAWERTLGTVRVSPTSERQLRIFYSALYRCFLMPTLLTEAGGRYRGFDREVHRAEGFEYYSDFSLWDTFRTLHPLVVLLDPIRARDFATSIIRMIEQGGAVPRWPLGTGYTNAMIGSSADILVADTYLKGITDFDVETAYDAMKRQAYEPKPDGARGPWRSGIEQYTKLGYIPNDVSKTLEYAYDDWALGNLAAALGHEEDAKAFRERSHSWRNLWDADANQIRPRDDAGAFPTSFNDRAHGGPYVEGDALQWSWYVPHDGAGVLEAFGSASAFVERLSELFENSTTLEPDASHVLPDLFYWHSNEPVLHAAYMFNDAGRPDLARKWARTAFDTQYGDGPDGLPGNDDSGTMSAWYVFTALGLYPIAGGTEYWLGEPIFERALIRRDAGDIEVLAPADGGSVGLEATVDGETVGPRIDHDRIRDGARLRFAGPE